MSLALHANIAMPSTLLDTLQTAGIVARSRLESLDLWRQTCARLDYCPVDYSSAMIDYQRAYWSGIGTSCIDASIVLEHDNRPCGVWPLCFVFNSNGKINIGSNGGPVLPPLFVSGVARKSVKSLTAKCIKSLETICQSISQPKLDSIEGFTDNTGLSEWHDQLMARSASVGLRHDLFINLSSSIADIKAVFRKSYKALITSGSKLWKVQVISTTNALDWDDFRRLHIAVAGRVTRSEESWQLQHEAVAAGDAFFVHLRDNTGRMVGAGFFNVTCDEGLYAVGAYDRSLFDKPLGHVVQFHAIEEMKRRGLRWYKIGARTYSSDQPPPTPKEIDISNFKQGFASHLMPNYRLRLEIGQVLPNGKLMPEIMSDHKKHSYL